MDEKKYNPSLTAKTARIFLPLLSKLLPRIIYKNLYDFLYSTYRSFIRYGYFLKNIFIYLGNSKINKIKIKYIFKFLPYTMGGPKALENAFELTYRIEKEKINGAIVECGIAMGGTAAMMSLTSEYFGKKSRDKWFFDSFEGLPDPTKEDYINGKTGNFIRPLPKGSCLGTYKDVSNYFFKVLKLSPYKTFLIKGWFQDTVPMNCKSIKEIAILRLDGDWYESTKIPLDYFFEKVSINGFIIIDDYYTCYGSKRAVDEFMNSNKLFFDLIPDGRGGVWFQKKINS